MQEAEMRAMTTVSDGLVRIATSASADPAVAAQDMISALRPDSLAGLMVFAGRREALEAVAMISMSLGGKPVIGCTTAGEITPWGPRQETVTGIGFPAADFAMQALHFDGLLGFDTFAAQPIIADMIGENEAAGSHLGADRSWAAVLLIDGLSCREELVTHTLQHLLGEIAMIGGSAAAGMTLRQTFLLHDGEVRSDRAVVALLSSRHPMRVFRCHYHASGDKLAIVTRVDSASRNVLELNGEPAAREYARLVGASGPLTQSHFAANPLMVRVAGEYFARAPMRADADGNLHFHSAVERGLVLRLGKANDALANLRAELRAPADAVIAFESVHNRIEAEDGNFTSELSALYQSHRFVGFHGYGEQHRDLHLNRNLVGLAIGGRS